MRLTFADADRLNYVNDVCDVKDVCDINDVDFV